MWRSGQGKVTESDKWHPSLAPSSSTDHQSATVNPGLTQMLIDSMGRNLFPLSTLLTRFEINWLYSVYGLGTDWAAYLIEWLKKNVRGKALSPWILWIVSSPELSPGMSMHLFYTRETAFSHILTLTHFRDLQHHLDSFNISASSNSEMSCTHLHHLRTFYHVSTHHTSTHLRIFNNHPHMRYMLPEPSHLCRHTSLHIPSYSRYIISHIQTS